MEGRLFYLTSKSVPRSKHVRFDYTGCPTRCRTRHFFNNSNTNEDIATKFEQKYVRCVRNEEECVCSVCLFRCNIVIDVRIIKEMLGSVSSGIPSILEYICDAQTHEHLTRIATASTVFEFVWNVGTKLITGLACYLHNIH
jgi:hypothetical protein